MCGRFVTAAIREVEEFFGRRITPRCLLDPPEPVYNVAPSMTVPVLHLAEGEWVTSLMAWGFVPHWWKTTDLPRSTINARLEEAATKPMWRAAMKSGRALVPMRGYYEWQQTAGAKQPYYIHGPPIGHLAFAALWSNWKPQPGAEPVSTFAILTTAAAPELAKIHHRMPVVLRTDAWEGWLDPALADGAAVTAYAHANAGVDFEAHAVSTYVNSPKNQGLRCIEPLAVQLAGGVDTE